jgi:hypothetical protein
MSSTLYVANLNDHVGRDEVERLFAPHGPVRSARMIHQSQSANGTRSAFVEMDSVEHAAAALAALDGVSLHGDALAVRWAHDEVTPGAAPPPPRMFESMNVPGVDEGAAGPGAGRRECAPMQPGSPTPGVAEEPSTTDISAGRRLGDVKHRAPAVGGQDVMGPRLASDRLGHWLSLPALAADSVAMFAARHSVACSVSLYGYQSRYPGETRVNFPPRVDPAVAQGAVDAWFQCEYQARRVADANGGRL